MMKEAFYTVDEEYRQKQYPRGYFAAIAKSGRQGGIALVILGLVILLMGVGLGFITFLIFMDSVKEGDTEGMVGPAVFMWIVALLFALGGDSVDQDGNPPEENGSGGVDSEECESQRLPGERDPRFCGTGGGIGLYPGQA